MAAAALLLGVNSADNKEAKEEAASDLEEGFIRKEPRRTSTCFIGGKEEEIEEVFEVVMGFEEDEKEEGEEKGVFEAVRWDELLFCWRPVI